jgi:hypothetical protein
MKESDLNTILTRSIKLNSNFGHKLSDQSYDQKPFDGFGIINKKPAYFESKLLKNDIKAFNFNLIEDHQFANLNVISEHLNELPHYTFISLGIWIPRKIFYVFFFDINFFKEVKESGKNSFLKKELLDWIEEKKFIPVSNTEINNKKYKTLDLTNLDGVLIKNYGKT